MQYVKQESRVSSDAWSGMALWQCSRMRTSDFPLLFCRYMLTPKDAEKYQSFRGCPSELHIVDQFMLEVGRHSVKTHYMLFVTPSSGENHYQELFLGT